MSLGKAGVSAVIQVCSARRTEHSHPQPPEAIGLLGVGKTTHGNTAEQFSAVLQLGTALVFGINSELLGI